MKGWTLIKENFEYWGKVHPYTLYRPTGEVCAFLDQEDVDELATLLSSQKSLSTQTPKPLDASNGRRIPVESGTDSERDRPKKERMKE